jgi:catechol 2,3-dioxygenase-like lactoylglutathione lyase family enzyme
MPKANGLHHLAISTGNIKEQIAFFTDVLGTELVALYWMHGVEGAWHAFLKLDDGESIAFVQNAEIPGIKPQIGVSHSGSPIASSAPGTMQHLALNVDSEEELLAMRDRIRSRNVAVLGPIDHGFCKSIYFGGPENLSLEISTTCWAIDPQSWIDPEVVQLAGISAEELASYTAPAPYEGQGGKVKQPAYEDARCHQLWPEEQYRKMLAMSDEAFTEMMSFTEPPVRRQAAE